LTRFTFKLEPLLEQRRHIEQQRQRELAVCQQAMLAIQAEVDEMAVLRRASRADLRSAGRGAANRRASIAPAGGRRLDAGLLAAHQRFEQAMRHKSTVLSRQLEAAQTALAQARAQLLDAARKRKIIEKLRERAHARWLQSQRQQQFRNDQELAALQQ
jgi:flagellar biosynthesis chaperone FliJ